VRPGRLEGRIHMSSKPGRRDSSHPRADNEDPAIETTDMANSKDDSAAVDAYLATLSRRERDTLQRLRVLIKETVPNVEERISYGTTVMFSLRRDLVGFVAQPKHLSFFIANPKLAAMKADIAKSHKVSGATIHFSSEKPLPTALVKKIVRARLRELQICEHERRPGERLRGPTARGEHRWTRRHEHLCRVTAEHSTVTSCLTTSACEYAREGPSRP
jgi:uncharacterized protein YdhG (YjbR/CyaY superfamily)